MASRERRHTDLSEAIVTMRKRQNMTQKQVEAATGILQVTLSRWENGAQPSVDDLARLGDGLGLARGAIPREAWYISADPHGGRGDRFGPDDCRPFPAAGVVHVPGGAGAVEGAGASRAGAVREAAHPLTRTLLMH